MRGRRDSGDFVIPASIGKHLAFAPVAFAVTEGPAHAVVYANTLFRRLQSDGELRIGLRDQANPVASDLAPVLDEVLLSARTVRDVLLTTEDGDTPAWSCSVWPVASTPHQLSKLVIEVRDVRLVESTKVRQRIVAEKLLLAAMREQDLGAALSERNARATHLAKTSRDLALSLDESATRDTIRKLTLPRPGTWCIVDVVESNGGIHRLAVAHPDPAKEALAKQLEEQWPTATAAEPASTFPPPIPTLFTHESGTALMQAAHGEANLRILREIGFGSLLVVPLIVRARVQGAITFVSPEGDGPFSAEEQSLAVDLASRCALALDNARLYREADALRLVAEMANQSKSQFLGSMSHELRTPLNAIGGFTELIDMEVHGPVTEQQHVALARIKANQEHLLKLVTEILNFVRIESGRMEYHHAEIDLTQALKDVTEMLSVAIAEKQLTLVGPADAPAAKAWADPDRVRQILVNLVMNAVKYAPGPDRSITVGCEVRGDTALATVADTGPGIAPDQLESIFEPFVQLTPGLTERRGGVGLGLAISRDLARAMGGDLTVESVIGRGTCFTLILPIGRSPSAA
jgi:signal transduction histidine kinase